MLRKTLTILSLIGLLFSVGLWGLSYFHVTYSSPASRLTVDAGSGGIVVQHFPEPESVDCLPESGWHFEGFGGFATQVRPFWDGEIGFFSIPLWIPTVLFGSTFAYRALPIHRRRKRKKLGLCQKCGYNLKGLTELRCPECGEAFEKQ